jgi:hypothetical protein
LKVALLKLGGTQGESRSASKHLKKISSVSFNPEKTESPKKQIFNHEIEEEENVSEITQSY